MPSIPSTLRERIVSPEAQDSFKRWFDAAPAYSGSVAANRLGWQVARTVAKHAAIDLRGAWRTPWVPDHYASTLDEHGVLVLPDYLAPDRYDRLREAYDRYEASPRVRDIGDENGSGLVYRSGQVISDQPGDAAAVINDTFARDPLVIALAQQIIHREIRPPMTVVCQSLALRDTPDDFDREQLLHTDKFFSCAKAIYFVDAVTPSSSPFIYCPGSHRLTPQRLQWEQTMGVREALVRAHRAAELGSGDDVRFERSRNVIGPGFRERLGLVETPIVCGPNTLVVVNNRGFHRRGTLRPGHTRRSLWINFYPYQRPRYGRAAFWTVKQFVDTQDVPRTLSAVNRQQVD